MTAFRRELRYQQAAWREACGHPIGTQPIIPRDGRSARLLGSRLPLDYAQETGANFLTSAARNAVEVRLAETEPHQMLDRQRLWADLLSSMPLCFNLFGDLAADRDLADSAVQALWPDAPGRVLEVRFEHSPGRLDPAYLGNLSAFDAAFVLQLDEGRSGVVAVETNYHEWAKPETAKPERLERYQAVADQAGIFVADVGDIVDGTGLLQVWLDHLLVLSMLQHHSGRWAWGRFVLVHPEGNNDFVEVCQQYRELLVDGSSFDAVTLEELLDAAVLPPASTAAFRERYLPG